MSTYILFIFALIIIFSTLILGLINLFTDNALIDRMIEFTGINWTTTKNKS